MIRPAFEGWTVVSALPWNTIIRGAAFDPLRQLLAGVCSIASCPRIAVKADRTSLAEP